LHTYDQYDAAGLTRLGPERINLKVYIAFQDSKYIINLNHFIVRILTSFQNRAGIILHLDVVVTLLAQAFPSRRTTR
jgi:hypothetical protein